MRGPIDTQIRAQLLKKFVSYDNDEKKDFLKERGIIWGGLYVGSYNKSTNRIKIDNLTNPFNNKVLEAIPARSGYYTEDFPIVIKLWINQKISIPRPEDVFFAEMVGGYIESLKAIQISNIIKQSKEKEDRIADLEEKNRGLFRDNLELNKKLSACNASQLQIELGNTKAELQKVRNALKILNEQQRESVAIEKENTVLKTRYKYVCESNKNLKEDNERLFNIAEKDRKKKAQLEEALKQETALRTTYYQENQYLREKNKSIYEWYRLVDDLRTKYGFEGFVHYTTYDNLKSILNLGYILSRDDVKRKGLDWIDVAEEAVIQDTPAFVKDKVRLLYGFNTPISYRFEEKAKIRRTEMVAIVIDPAIFTEYQLWFYKKSAARSSYGRPYTSVNDLHFFKWDEIFERGPYAFGYEYKKKYRDAEVVLDGPLSTEHIIKIYFRSEMFLNKAIAEIGHDDRFMIGRISENGQFTPGV